MKNTPRIQRNDATKAASLQCKSHVNKMAKANPITLRKGDKLGRCLCLYDIRDGMPVAKIPLSEKELFDVLQLGLDYKSTGKTSFDIIAEAIREKLAGQGSLSSLRELELAKNEANALFQLLTDKMEHQGRSGGGEWNDPIIKVFCEGVSQLAAGTKARLDDAFNEAFSSILAARKGTTAA
jgi:hypothetical protein